MQKLKDIIGTSPRWLRGLLVGALVAVSVGVWYEFFSSSPVVELSPAEHATRTCQTIHTSGHLPDLNQPSRILLGSEILTPPPEMQRSIQHWIDIFHAPRYRDRLRSYFVRIGRVEPLVEEFFPPAGVPTELQFLAVIESGGNPQAVSSARAVGIWQFMSYTGRDWGLKVSHYHDQRRDPVASTRAAAQYLSDLHRDFGSWPLALAAYNGGPNRLRRIQHRQPGLSFWEVVQSPHLPAETRKYVPKFFAALLIGRQPQRYGMGRILPAPARAFEETKVPPASRLRIIAQSAGISLTRLRHYNPHFPRDLSAVGDSAHIRLPSDHMQQFVRRYREVADSLKVGVITHQVRPRETLGRIAHQYGTSIQALMEANGSPNPQRLQIGQEIQVPRLAE